MLTSNLIRKLCLLLVLSLLTLSLVPSPPSENIITSVHAQTDWGKMPLYFIPNQGQVDDQVAYYVQGKDKTLFFTSQGITFSLKDDSSPMPSPFEEDKFTSSSISGVVLRKTPPRWTVKLDFVEANQVQPQGQEQTQAIVSYFKGPSEEWQTGLPTYSKLVYSNLWNGIDLSYSGTVDRLKYEFVVQPGVDPAQIHLRYRGGTMSLNHAGQLEVSTPVGNFQDEAPIAYQEVNGQRIPVKVDYSLLGVTTYGFYMGDYDPSLPLVIDPAVLVYCGFIGGSGDLDNGYGITVDSSGYVYLTGYTNSTQTTFPVTVGPDPTYNSGSSDAFVAKVRADGTGLVYAGYIGGNGLDVGRGIDVVETVGDVVIIGDTDSDQSSFPVTVGPDLTYNGGTDAFVAKLNASGTTLIYCGYIGGSDLEYGMGIDYVVGGNAYVVGTTRSTEATFPEIVGPDLTYNGGNSDAFVARVNATGSQLLYAGYIGGSGSDKGEGIVLDAFSNAYISGSTTSGEASFPETVGPDLTFNGVWDAFVAKVNTSGTGLVYAGYLGGTGDDRGHGIALSNYDNAYVTGKTGSTQTSFPVLVGPDLTYNGGYNDAFVARVNSAGSGLVYAGYIGGIGEEEGLDIAVNSSGEAYVTGYTFSNETTFPILNGPDYTLFGSQDVFMTKVMAGGIGLVYSGYIGGDSGEVGRGIAIDSASNAYIVGDTNSTDATFPVIVGPDLTFNGGTLDAFVVKISEVAFNYRLYMPIARR